MEHTNIEILLEKYFEGETSIAEEKELTNYFSSPNVAQHLEQYKSLFGYFSQTKKLAFLQEIPLQPKNNKAAWLSIAASVVVLLGVGTFVYLNNNQGNQNKDLGTYNDPEIAFKETQKALAMLATHVNVGIESVHYVKEYENSKNLIFKQ